MFISIEERSRRKTYFDFLNIFFTIMGIKLLFLNTGYVIIIDAFQHNGNLQRFIRDCQVIHSINDREH